MMIEKKDKQDFNTAFHRRQKLYELLENTRKAMLGEEPQMKAELKKIELAVVEEIQKSNTHLKSFEKLLVETEHRFLRKDKVKQYEEVENSDIPLKDMNK